MQFFTLCTVWISNALFNHYMSISLDPHVVMCMHGTIIYFHPQGHLQCIHGIINEYYCPAKYIILSRDCVIKPWLACTYLISSSDTSSTVSGCSIHFV